MVDCLKGCPEVANPIPTLFLLAFWRQALNYSFSSSLGMACRKTYDHFLVTGLPRISNYSDRTRSSSPQFLLCFSVSTEQNCHQVLERGNQPPEKSITRFPTSAGCLALPSILRQGHSSKFSWQSCLRSPPFWMLKAPSKILQVLLELRKDQGSFCIMVDT